MTNYEIYQINRDRDVDRVKFWDYNFAVNMNGGVFNFSIYDKVYSGDRDVDCLDDLFDIFNNDHPADFRGHSMSMSDIVRIISSDKMDTGYFYCDSFGWKKVEM